MLQQGEYLPLAYMDPNRLSIILPLRLPNHAVSDPLPCFTPRVWNGMIESPQPAHFPWLSTGSAGEVEIDVHPSGAAQRCCSCQDTPRGLSG